MTRSVPFEIDQVRMDLMAVRELLSKPERWTQGAMARNELGWGIYLKSPNAVQWCLMGAIGRVAHEKFKTLERVRDQLGLTGVEQWNDDPNRTHAQVLALLDRALS